MYEEEMNKIHADNQESEQRLQQNLLELKEAAADYSNSLINCATNYDLPEPVERALLDITAGYADLVKGFENVTQETNSLRSQVMETLLINYELLERNNKARQQQESMQEEYNALDRLSVWQFFVRKVKQRWNRKETLAGLYIKLEQLEQEKATLLSQDNDNS